MVSACDRVRQSCADVIQGRRGSDDGDGDAKAMSVQLSEPDLERLAQEAMRSVKWSVRNVITKTPSVHHFENTVYKQGRLGQPSAWDRSLHYYDPHHAERTAQYLLAVDALNFCFWEDAEFEYEHLAGGLKQSLQRDPQILDAGWMREFERTTIPIRADIDYMSSLKSDLKFAKSPERLANGSADDVSKLLGWPRPLPLSSERSRLLREIGQGLARRNLKQRGFSGLIEIAGGSASGLVEEIVQTFPGFQDHCIYPRTGQQVFFYKRAQILVGDTWGCFQGQGLGKFANIHELTTFADYRVPALLIQRKALKVDDSLEKSIHQGTLLPAASAEEIELRAASVLAVTKMMQMINDTDCDDNKAKLQVSEVSLDWWLWETGEAIRDSLPHHRTKTIFY